MVNGTNDDEPIVKSTEPVSDRLQNALTALLSGDQNGFDPADLAETISAVIERQSEGVRGSVESLKLGDAITSLKDAVVLIEKQLPSNIAQGDIDADRDRKVLRRKGLSSLLAASELEDLQSISGVFLQGASWDDYEADKKRGDDPEVILGDQAWSASDEPLLKFIKHSLPSSTDGKPELLKKLKDDAKVLKKLDKAILESKKDGKVDVPIEEGNGKKEFKEARQISDTRWRKLQRDLRQYLDECTKPGAFEIYNDHVTDKRTCRLYIKIDLSEWLEIKNCDVLHVVDEEPNQADGYAPLGRTTVWLKARAQIKHVRSKTAKTFIRGRIADRLRIEDIESNVGGFVNTIFDTDSEQAYSSTSRPC